MQSSEGLYASLINKILLRWLLYTLWRRGHFFSSDIYFLQSWLSDIFDKLTDNHLIYMFGSYFLFCEGISFYILREQSSMNKYLSLFKVSYYWDLTSSSVVQTSCIFSYFFLPMLWMNKPESQGSHLAKKS